MDIVEFLTARLDDDEAVAKAAGVGPRDKWRTIEWYDGQFENGLTVSVDVHGVAGAPVTSRGNLLRADGEHIARHDPARVLAEVAAKRRIMERHFADQDGSCVGCGFNSVEERSVEDINACPELRDMASVYDSHPDHKQEWKPIAEFVRKEDYFSKPPALPPGWAIAPNRPKGKEST